MPLAFSYLRFSSPAQAAGDSIRRQLERSADWCRRHRATLDTSVTLRDDGVSAFRGRHRENPDTHALASFLRAVEAGRIPAGSYLVVESLDRLSREKIRPALTLLLKLIEAGVKVVQLIPVEMMYDEDTEPMALMQAIMELSRGHSESKVKSERVGAAWARKRKDAATRILTRRVPGWVRHDGAKLALDPVKAATVRRIFALAIGGAGVWCIARQLNAERVPVVGRTVYRGKPVLWSETVVYCILTSRATIGEYHPHKGRGSDREPAGEPIPHYYPAAVDADTFHAAQASIGRRATCGRGKRGHHVNLFAGLLHDARDGDTLTYRNFRGKSTLIPVGAKQGRGSVWSCFPAAPLEAAVLSELAEVRPSDVRGDAGEARKVEALSGRLAELDALAGQWRAKMDDPRTVDVVAAKLAELGGRRQALASDLDAARRDAASPVAGAWGEFRTLAELLTRDPSDELRGRVRAALRRAVESVHCLFTGAGRLRRAAVRVQFRGGMHRDYHITYEPGRSNRHVKRVGVWSVRTFAEAGIPVDLDLRDPADAARLLRIWEG